jgi:hypothetical protein
MGRENIHILIVVEKHPRNPDGKHPRNPLGRNPGGKHQCNVNCPFETAVGLILIR